MMLDWNEYRKQVGAGVKEIGQLSPDTIRGYMELSSAGQKKNLLGAKTREFIARRSNRAQARTRLRRRWVLRQQSMLGLRWSIPHA